MENTRINLMYRDADNYKVHGQAVFAGKITQDQIKSVSEVLEYGSKIIARQVGLVSLWESLVEDGKKLTEESDHVYTELSDFSYAENYIPDASKMWTDEAPTDGRHIDEFCKQLAAVQMWDISAEWDLMLKHMDDEDDEHCDEEDYDSASPAP